jgi:hypothetical protein
MDTAPPTPVRPAERYGDVPSRRRRRVVVAAVAVLAVVGVAFVVWAGLAAAQREVRWDDVGYRVVDDTTVELTFNVVKDPGATVECRLQALSGSFAQVGLATVEVGPAPERAVQRTATIRTQERAVTAVVDTCRVS